ncbi:kanamycin biosynthetic protein [Streptomyces hygroscopicus]|uniref:antitoxin n=1 Tax=Streptomyces hygroscopicus TaxID=1912 RepID=UPI0022409E9A|nr:antitoxin [Streptomyces hygroscopicus]MCW7942897.1 kanamycin biosynthetic protein [Streptomyces hygroscopicus]
MSVMDKLKHMLRGREHEASEGVDKGHDTVDDKTGGQGAGQVDKGPDALREQFRSQQERENPPQP